MVGSHVHCQLVTIMVYGTFKWAADSQLRLLTAMTWRVHVR
jgi:hypothetical protein